MTKSYDPDPPESSAELQAPALVGAVPQANFGQAQALTQQGHLAEAERICRQILHRNPNDFAALHLLGEIAFRTRQTERAIELFDRSIALKPDFAEAYSDRGMALRKLKRFADAVASYDKAIGLRPDFAMAYNNRANALLDMDRPAEALVSCDEAIALNPGLVIAHYNRGNALEALKRPEEALPSFERATELRPNFAEANWNKALCLLLLGRFEHGLPLYEWRKWRAEPVATRTFREPIWLGKEDIAGKTLFLWWEQGFGDTMQFCRYAALAQARGAKVIMAVQNPLLKLLEQSSPTVAVIGPDDVPSVFDYHCPLLSLPLAFGTTLAAIPAQQQYLQADEQLRVAWAARLPPKRGPRIGLVWSGRTDHKNDRNRSMELRQFLPILSADADWVCLQNEVREKDLAVLRQYDGVKHFGDELKDFSDTAALLDLMDLVITVDTSVAHLAGAMGKPVWILLPYNPDWRWLLDRADSPWYPSARLFRQPRLADWVGVIDQVSNELRSMGVALAR